MRFLFVLSVMLFNNFSSLEAQNILVKQNALFMHLLRDSISVTNISLSLTQIIPQPLEFSKNKQQLVKSGNSLYLFIDGTGRVYKAIKWDDKQVFFSRVDSTFYFGYNQGSRKLIINDTLFSYGGYGFWHYNGCLTYFTPHKEWEMQPLNKDIPFFNNNDRYSSIAFFDDKNLDLYFSAAPIVQQTVINGIENDSFYVLNIANRNLKTLGKNLFSKAIFEKFMLAKKLETPYGILFDCPLDDNRDFILDLKNNKIYTSNKRILQSLIPSSAYSLDNMFFYQNGYLYASSPPFEKIDSLLFDFSNFKLIETKVYEQKSSKIINFSNDFLIIISVLLLLFISLFFIIQKRKSIKNIEISNEQEEVLSALERQLLNDFISMIESRGYCSTDELNNLLGVGYKSTEIKKKARTDFITKVNYKLRTHFSSDSDIIIRDRSDLDKRSFLYSIKEEMIDKIKKML